MGGAPLPPSLRTALEQPLHGHLVTMNADGSPQVTLVWVGVDGDELVTAHMREWHKVGNIRRDPRVAVSFETDRLGERDLLEYAVVYGQGRITEGGAAALLQQLAQRYAGPDVVFPGTDDEALGYIAHIAIDRVTGNGPWTRGE